MSTDPSSVPSGLPPGETDPNRLYVAVGRAIHAWEGLEEALARLCLKLTGVPETPANLAAYGQANRRFADRMIATRKAADNYFIKRSDQGLEGDFSTLHTDILAMGIERHRIAHGHITMIAEFKIPDVKGPFKVTAAAMYCWGPPFYSANSLRTDPFGVGAAQIDALTEKFMTTHNRVSALTERMI